MRATYFDIICVIAKPGVSGRPQPSAAGGLFVVRHSTGDYPNYLSSTTLLEIRKIPNLADGTAKTL